MVLVHDTSSECALQMCAVSFINGDQVIEWEQNSIANGEREITPKVSKAEFNSCA